MSQKRRSRGIDLRAQILLILFGGAIRPSALVGLWLSSITLRSGEELLRSHLDASADRFTAAIAARWEYRRADLALIAGNESAIKVARGLSLTADDRTYLESLAASVARTIPNIELRDASAVWFGSPDPLARPAVPITARIRMLHSGPPFRCRPPSRTADGSWVLQWRA